MTRQIVLSFMIEGGENNRYPWGFPSIVMGNLNFTSMEKI